MSDFFDDVFTAYCNSYNECASCPLGKETGDCRDLFARKMKAWAVKQLDMAAAETAPHTATDTNLPRSAKRSVGEDENVPTTLPKWVKKGQWVKVVNAFSDDEHLGEIVEVKRNYYAVRLVGFTELFGFGVDSVSKAYPIRFRPYTYEEAAKLIGKVMKLETDAFRRIEMITEVHGDKAGGIAINCKTLEDLTNEYNATIDGTPIGVPEVDEESLKEVEK